MYTLVYYAGYLLTLLPWSLMYGFSAMLSFVVYHLGLYRKKMVMENLRNSFPDWSGKEIRKIARGFYRHFADQVMESFRMMHMSEKSILGHMHYENPELLGQFYEKGQSVLLTTAHYGNWEWMVSLPLVLKHKVLVVFKPPFHKGAHWVYTRFGSRFGGIPVPIDDVPRTLLKYRAEKECTATFILNDQRPLKRDIRYWNTFLGQDTPWQNGVERLAMKTGQAVLYIRLERRKRGYYHLAFHTLSETPGDSAPDQITEAYARILEKSILRDPAIWLWTHNRWKHTK